MSSGAGSEAKAEIPLGKGGDAVNHSASVREAINRFNAKPTTAAGLAADILISHSGYASGRGDIFGAALANHDESQKGAGIKPALAWIEQVTALYDGKSLITGRCLVVGLALLDQATRELLLADGFLAELSREKQIDLPSAMHGLNREWKEFLCRLIAPPSGSAETFSDLPSKSDHLGRYAFAEVLATRIRRLRSNEPGAPIAVHLDGPWGSGKSTVLNFLELALTVTQPAGEQPWLVIRYNAWQQQRLDSPWWTLTARVVCDGARDLAKSNLIRAWKLRLRHYHFRTLSGRMSVLIAGLFAVGAGVALYRLGTPADGEAKPLMSLIKDLLSIIVTVFGILLAGSRFLTASDTAAKDFLRSRSDPLGALSAHLESLLKDIGRNVVIFVDDIDRCDAAAVVKILEGIHTVFTTIPIAFVVAGDGRWIGRAFEKAYAEAAPAAERTAVGQTLGGLFVEKLFQISTAVPHMSSPIKEAFWKQLLNIEERKPLVLGGSRTTEISELRNEEDILRVVKAADVRRDPQKALELREAAMLRLAAPDLIEKPARHVLEVFYDCIEANPRAMKRQVMAYGMARATDLASFRNTPQDMLAAWSVLSLRWPVLAQWLSEKPQRLAFKTPDHRTDAELNDDDRNLIKLMQSPAASRLLKYIKDANTFEEMIGSDTKYT